ncbi:TonB-dependent receptor domain-containing protein [Mameliella sp.]|uniref:TonB-dependent receptor domain-containing protein n=1 Tax=Mameliella sp. TaxID=1924940 RepID=UPI003B511083
MTGPTGRGALLLGTCLFSFATPSAAQDTDPVFLGTLRIISESAQTLLGNHKIDEEQLEQRNPASVADVFRGESSVAVSGGAAIAQKVFVNGIEESLLSVTIDGARQNKSAFHHTGNILFDPALLKSVEVSEGIAPADAGPNALAGGLAYTTMDARDFLEPGERMGGLTTLRGSSNGQGFRRSLTLFGQEEGFEWLLSGTRQTGDDYKDGDGKTVAGTEADLSAYVFKFAFTSDSGKRLSFSASDTEDTGRRSAQAGPGGILFTRPDFAEVVGRPSVFVEGLSRRTSYTLTYQDEAPQGWFAPFLQLSYNEQEIDASGVWGLNTSLSGIARNEWQLGNGTLTAGLDFFHETAEGRGLGPGAFGSSGEETLSSIGLFAQARQDLSDRLSVSYGARLDHQEFKGANGARFEENGLSINGAVDVTLSDTLSLNAGLASSWGGFELGEAALINFGGDWDYTGFASSRSDTARLGLRYESGPWAISGAVFHTEIRDIAAVLPSGGARGTLADLTSQGFDGSVGYTGARGFARVNYTFADVELDGAPIGSTAYYFGRPVGHLIGLEAGYDVTSEWRVGGNAEIALENDLGSVTLPAYEVVNVYTAYKPKSVEGLEVRLDVENLFDQTYASRSADGLGLGNVVPLNEPGRTVSLTASLRF